MERFVINGTKEINNKIKNDLSQIVQAVTKIVKPESIILGGGFGRGEGSVKIVNGKIKPQNDYDIWIITNHKIPQSQLVYLRKSLAQRLGIDYVDIAVLNSRQLRTLPPSQIYYDLKHGSKVIYGDSNVLNLIPNYDPASIPKWDGLKLLFNRMAGVLGGFSAKALVRGYEEGRATDYQKNQLLHALIACGDAILIFRGKYHHLYSQKVSVVKKELAKLGILSDDEVSLVYEAYTERLWPSPSFNVCADNGVLKTVHLLLKVLDWCLNAFLSLSDSYTVPLSKKLTLYVDKMSKGKSFRLIKAILALVKTGDRSSFGDVWSPKQHRIYAAIALTLFAIVQKDTPALSAALKLMGWKKPVEGDVFYKDILENFRKFVYAEWEACCH